MPVRRFIVPLFTMLFYGGSILCAPVLRNYACPQPNDKTQKTALRHACAMCAAAGHSGTCSCCSQSETCNCEMSAKDPAKPEQETNEALLRKPETFTVALSSTPHLVAVIGDAVSPTLKIPTPPPRTAAV